MIGELSEGNARLNARLPSKESVAPKESDAASFAKYHGSRDSTSLLKEGPPTIAKEEPKNDVAVDKTQKRTTMAKLTQTRNLKIGTKGGNKNRLHDAIEGESIAETLSRIQLKLKPESDRQKLMMMTPKMDPRSSEEGNVFPYGYPKIRYVEWDDLTEWTTGILESSFGYKKGSWNRMSNTIESRDFSSLDDDQQKLLSLMAIDENVWDCFINHYSAYSRKDLQRKGLYDYVTTLTDMSSKKWARLNAEQKSAATQLCYSEDIWDKRTLGTWEIQA